MSAMYEVKLRVVDVDKFAVAATRGVDSCG